jgi:sugar O-acyltransferase (sialic acid O-acetyltransferase NeuD family)
MKEIYILGVGHNTSVYIELAELNGYTIKGLYHYENGKTGQLIHNIPIIGTNDDLFNHADLNGKNFALSMGDNKIRVNYARQIREKGGNLPTLIHPTASVSKYAQIDEGVVIHANSTIQPDVVIQSDTVISFNVGITHNTTIESGCYVAGQTIVGAYIHIHEMAFIGMGSTLISGKVKYIGKKAIIGAGSVVTSSVEENSIVFGNPAKKKYGNV